MYFESPHPIQEDWDHEARGRDNDGNFAVTTMTVDYTPDQLFWSGASGVDGIGKADQHVWQGIRINRNRIRIAGQSEGDGNARVSIALYYIRTEVHRPILAWSATGAAARSFDQVIPTVEGGQYRLVVTAAVVASTPEAPRENAQWNFVIEEAE